jgi:O-antigen ligase
MTFAVIAALVGTGAGLTGRDIIWSEFLSLWRQSPWLGIGTTGISENLDLTRGFTHAHNMLLDELVRYGLLTTLLLVAVLLVGAVLPTRAAVRGYSGPLAILCAYGVLTVTEVRNDWQQPSILVLLVVICVLIANSWLADDQEGALSPSTSTVRL